MSIVSQDQNKLPNYQNKLPNSKNLFHWDTAIDFTILANQINKIQYIKDNTYKTYKQNTLDEGT